MERSTGIRQSAEAVAFEHYVRTGVRLSARTMAVELKFNPWHDPENGRFTFIGQGRYFGDGSAASIRGEIGNGRGKARRAISITVGSIPTTREIARSTWSSQAIR